MGKLVAIGGGSLARLETLPIDRQIIRLTGKRRPNVLFVPTATVDSGEYCENFHAAYGGKLGCPVETLLLYRDRPSANGIKQRILAADVIYVGGGNTLRMMKFWRKLGIDELLRRAWRKGTVLCGVSAGAICWLDWGCSDSRSFSGREDWEYIRVHGLGLLGAAGCPHYHGEKRERAFAEMIRKHRQVGIAIDDHAALEVVDDEYRVLTSRDSGRMYRLIWRDGGVVTESLEQRKKPRSLRELLKVETDKGRKTSPR